MKILYIFLIASVYLFSQEYSALGYGENIKEAKNDALQNLSLQFMANTGSDYKITKKSDADNFSTSSTSTLSIKSKLKIPNVHLTRPLKNRNNLYEIKAWVKDVDIAKYAENLVEQNNKNLYLQNEDNLIDLLEVYENLEKLLQIINTTSIEKTLTKLKNNKSYIEKLLDDAMLDIDLSDKKIEIFINNKKRIKHPILLKLNTKYKLKVVKKGYFTILEEMIFYHRGKVAKEFIFIKNKKRNIHLKINKKYLDKLSYFLKKFEIEYSNKYSKKFEIYFDRPIVKYIYNTQVVRIVGYLNIKNAHKTIQSYKYSFKQKCHETNCKDDIKIKIIKNLIKKALAND